LPSSIADRPTASQDPWLGLASRQPLALARATTSQSLLRESDRRISASTKSVNGVDRTAYLEEANFLVRRAKNINPELDLDRELKQIKERWEKSAKESQKKE
jgi:hypothetical protein